MLQKHIAFEFSFNFAANFLNPTCGMQHVHSESLRINFYKCYSVLMKAHFMCNNFEITTKRVLSTGPSYYLTLNSKTLIK